MSSMAPYPSYRSGQDCWLARQLDRKLPNTTTIWYDDRDDGWIVGGDVDLDDEPPSFRGHPDNWHAGGSGATVCNFVIGNAVPGVVLTERQARWWWGDSAVEAMHKDLVRAARASVYAEV